MMDDYSEVGRAFRQRKKLTGSETICPICEITVRTCDLDNHYQLEMGRLIKFQLNPKIKKSITNGSSGYHESLPSTSVSPTNGNSGTGENGCPWIKFQKIRSNRHQRLKIKSKKRKADDPICPVCNEHPTEDINLHVEKCLRKSDQQKKINGTTSDDDDESIDIEGESFEEYEWAGQKRIRASTLLQGGYSAAGIGNNCSYATTDDEDEDLNVDGDDTQIYGANQYTEKDVIIPLSGDCDHEIHENLYLRQLVTGQDVYNQQQQQQEQEQQKQQLQQQQQQHGDGNDLKIEVTNNCNNLTITPTIQTDSTHQIIESLKSKIREYENQISNKIKCLICMDEFHNPAVSICCWHVHCEECWLRTLGARKLCPQCNMITSPTDLRRIYM